MSPSIFCRSGQKIEGQKSTQGISRTCRADTIDPWPTLDRSTTRPRPEFLCDSNRGACWDRATSRSPVFRAPSAIRLATAARHTQIRSSADRYPQPRPSTFQAASATEQGGVVDRWAAVRRCGLPDDCSVSVRSVEVDHPRVARSAVDN